ncbi:MAG: hypothetical protein WA705_15915 [Candidatus Ozemobacteraceae bacterium]
MGPPPPLNSTFGLSAHAGFRAIASQRVIRSRGAPGHRFTAGYPLGGARAIASQRDIRSAGFGQSLHSGLSAHAGLRAIASQRVIRSRGVPGHRFTAGYPLTRGSGPSLHSGLSAWRGSDHRFTAD